ncbi:MAG: CBS domain-containing protein [Candidatus Bathyarchaeota archaeon]|nr:MAG: CBS domain-containing protein [Candidatus Bathyarchaeota archaeon]
MKIEKFMIEEVVTLKTGASAHDAVKLMNKKGIGCLVIVDNIEILGILTERDLLERVLEKCRDPRETSISDIMTRQVITGNPDMQLIEAARLMFENKVKKLPIVRGRRLVGLITVTDIARAASVDEKTIELVETLSNMHLV